MSELYASSDRDTLSKISPALLKELLASDGSTASSEVNHTTFLVHLVERADVESAALTADAALSAHSVVSALQETARVSQEPLMTTIEQLERERHIGRYTSYWIFNGFAIEGNLHAALAIAKRPEVADIRQNRVHHLPVIAESDAENLQSDLWNITKIGAQQVWQTYGMTGEGVVVANMDSGVDWTHPALQPSYRGYNANNPVASDHNHNWFDPTGSYPTAPGPNVAHAGSQSDHGSHTMGSIVGAEPDGSQVYGVAPGAQWIAVKAFTDDGATTDEWLHAGFQWLLAPTDLNGEYPDPSRAPDIVNNSWGNDEANDVEFAPDLAAWKAAGILSTWAAGNEGPAAGTINAPGAISGALSVGATDGGDGLAYFSSRGPAPSGEIKPDVCAPGVSIRSTIAGGGISSWQGTSMATPHVTGLAALLYEASEHSLTITETQFVITSTVVDLGEPGKDNLFGYGRIDAVASIEYVVASGTIEGTVRDQETGQGIAGALVTASDRSGQVLRSCHTDSQGTYAMHIPEGQIDLAASAFGYLDETVLGVDVPHSASLSLDIELEPLPQGTLAITVRRAQDGLPAPAYLSLLGFAIEKYVDEEGTIEWDLPADTYGLQVKPAGVGLTGVQLDGIQVIANETVSLTVDLEALPTILFVHGDAWLGEDAWSYYQQALDALLYGYDLFEVANRYDTPDPGTLMGYDIVIWANSISSPGYSDAWETLGAYLDAGGALLLSGQDIGYWDDDGGVDSAYRRYLNAELVADTASGTALASATDGPWHDIDLVINSAASAMNQNSPDALGATSVLAQPIAAYADGSAAALAIDACTYRAIYAGFGLEGVGPLDQRTRAIEQAIAWLASPPSSGAIEVSLSPPSQTVELGTVPTVQCSVLNRNASYQTVTLSTASRWPLKVYDSGHQLVGKGTSLAPCEAINLTIEITVPDETLVGDREVVTVTLTPADSQIATSVVSATLLASPPWQEVAQLPHALVRAATAVGECRVLIAGGTHDGVASRELWALDADTGVVTPLAPMPTAASQAAGVLNEDKLYVLGGFDDAAATVLDAVQIYDVSSDTWSLGPSLPQPVCGATAASLDTSIYVFGGTDGNTATAAAYMLPAGGDSWHPLAPLSSPVAYAEAVTHNNDIYLAGGWPDLAQLWRYEPVADAWHELAPMLYGRQSFCFASDGAFLYAAGGGSTWQGLGVAERYDPLANAWLSLPNLIDTHRAGGIGGLVHGRLIVAGGTGPYDTTSVEMLDVGIPLATSLLKVNSTQVQSGETLAYTLLLKNPSHQPAEAALTLTLPTEIEVVSTGHPNCVISSEPVPQVTYRGGMEPRSIEHLGVYAQVRDQVAYGAELMATVEIEGMPCASEPLAQTTTSILLEPSLHASTLVADRQLAGIGDLISYEICVANESPFDIDDIWVVGHLPWQANLVPDTLVGASYFPADHTVRWQGQLAMAAASNTLDWRDATDGLSLTLCDDCCSTSLPLGFDFEFYGTSYEEIVVSSNGLVIFDGCETTFTNVMLPSTTLGHGVVAPFWDDLNPSRQGAVYFDVEGQAPNRTAIVSWEDVPAYSSDEGLTFQVLLFEGINGIVCQYRDMPGERGDGSSATVGLQSPDGSQAEVYLFDAEPAEHLVYDGLVVALDQPSTAWGTRHTISFATQIQNSGDPGENIVCSAVISDGLHVHTRVVTSSLVTEERYANLPLIRK